MFNAFLLFSLLFLTWIILSGIFNFFYIVLGVGSCLVSVYIYMEMSKNEKKIKGVFGITLRLVKYFFWLVVEIVKSSLEVSNKMWQLEPEISPELSWISTNMKGDDIGITLLGTSITLTPGTVTTGVRSDGMVQVHALTKDGMESLRQGKMRDKVSKVVNFKVEG